MIDAIWSVTILIEILESLSGLVVDEVGGWYVIIYKLQNHEFVTSFCMVEL